MEPTSVAAKPRLVVVGNGMAGVRTLERLLALAPDKYHITVFGAEPCSSYNRVLLSPLLAGAKALADVVLHDRAWYRRGGITLHTGCPVVTIDRVARRVVAADGTVAPYDRLLLATGSNPIVLPLPGAALPGVMAFRDLEDAYTLMELAAAHPSAAVIGGGLLGLEAAHGLARRGMAVTVVHLADTLMERQLDVTAAGLLAGELARRGIAVRTNTQTVAIEGAQRVTGLRFQDGGRLAAEVVVMAVGIRPNCQLAKDAGLPCGRGVLVDDTLQTFDPRIYAVGECVQHRGATYGLVAPLWEQADVCATHLAEWGIGRYRGSMVSTRLKVAGVELFSAGDFHGAPGEDVLVYRDRARGIYKKLVIGDDRLKGALLYGDAREGGRYFDLIQRGTALAGERDSLMFPTAAAAA